MTAPPGPPPRRKLRADAAANRERVVASARRAFGRSGPAASLDAIAADAGVGNATLYRHFPTRDELFVAVYAERLTKVREFLEAHADGSDPWAAFEAYVRHLVAAPDVSLLGILAMEPEDTPGVAPLRREIRVLVGRLVERAQRAGVLRGDFDLDDLNVFLSGHAHAWADGLLPAARRDRFVEHYLDGLRARS